MVVRLARKVTTYDWIRCHDDELRALGVDASRRLAVTGHRWPLRMPWLHSIGCWGQYESRELIDESAPHEAVLPVTAAAFRKFKSRWGLKTREQWKRCHGSYAWSIASACFDAYERAARVFVDSSGVVVPVGLACEYAVATAAAQWRARPLGLLPIELVLHVRSFHAFLAHHGVEPEDWRGLTPQERDELWALGGAPPLGDFLRKPASERLEPGVASFARGA